MTMKTQLLLLASIAVFHSSNCLSAITNDASDPCCSFPCQHMGVCLSSSAEKYECDCTGTGYYGTQCETPDFSTKLRNWIKPSKDTLHYFLTHFSWLWKIINNNDYIRKSLMKMLLQIRLTLVDDPHMISGFDEYPNWESYTNRSSFARSLPAVPLNCPTPMGVKGKKTLPDAELLIEKFLKRKSFTPCPRRTSVVFPFFAQHFSHQFFKTDYKKGLPYQWGDHALDLSHVYGHTLERQLALRSLKNGKLKYSLINGEMFPPTIEQANVEMDGIDKVEKPYQFAVGHPGFTIQPTLLFFATLWLREHNRVCEILKKEHPSWDDERLFQTSRLILTGETLKIVIEDYVQHLSGYNYKLIFNPELLHDSKFSYHNRIFVEFQILYRWHALMPDHLHVSNQTYSVRNLLFNPKPFVEQGMENWIKEAKRQFAGKVAGGKTQGEATLNVARHAILDGRKLRLQSFNRYRERFGMKPYKSFHEFTDDPKMAADLEEIYGDIDALEFYVGVMLEKRRVPLMFGQTLTEVGSPFSLKGIFANPIGSPHWWKPSTFGGETGFKIAKTTNLQELVCRNVKGCPAISFEVPNDVEYKPVNGNFPVATKDNSSQILMNITRGFIVPDVLIEPIKHTYFDQMKQSPVKDNVKSEL